METRDIPEAEPSLWVPMTNLGDIALIGKFQEELGECIQILARALIQGLEEFDPETGKLNLHALEDEIADVQALIRLAKWRFGLNPTVIGFREEKKFQYKKKWIDQLDEKFPRPSAGTLP